MYSKREEVKLWNCKTLDDVTNGAKKDTSLVYLSNLRGTELIIQGSTCPDWTVSYQLLDVLVTMSEENDKCIRLG